MLLPVYRLQDTCRMYFAHNSACLGLFRFLCFPSVAQMETSGLAQTPQNPEYAMRFAVRGSSGLELWKPFPEVAKDDSFTWYNLAQPRKFSVTHLKPSTTGQQLVFSEDGQMFAIMHAESVVVYTSGTNEEVAKLAESNVVYVRFSPQNLFLLTWKRWAKDQATALHGNVGIWELKSGTQSHSFVQKKLQGCVFCFFFFLFFFSCPLSSPSTTHLAI